MSAPTSDAWWTRSTEPAADTLTEPPAVTVVLPNRSGGRPAVRATGPGTPGGTGTTEGETPGARRRPAGPRWVAAATAAVATVTGAGLGVLLLRPEAPRAVAAPARAVPVDPAGITAHASSTQAPDGAITYAAANTLDGDPATAWNSNGKRDGAGPGITLTYTFAELVDLRGITVRNGYQKVRQRAGRAPVDLYPVNERVRRVRVVTDAGRWTWDLADTRAPQTFPGATGRTGSVRLEIVTVYPSTSYPDVALSEVSFSAG